MVLIALQKAMVLFTVIDHTLAEFSGDGLTPTFSGRFTRCLAGDNISRHSHSHTQPLRKVARNCPDFNAEVLKQLMSDAFDSTHNRLIHC